MIIMSKKEKFIEVIDNLIANGLELDEEANAFYLEFKKMNQKVLTEKGRIILLYMRKEENLFNNIFKAKDIADGIGISGKGVSGSMKKLINDGFVDKIGANPVCYSLTDLGKNFNIE